MIQSKKKLTLIQFCVELALVLHVLHQVGPLALIRGDDAYLFRIDTSLDEPVKVKIIKIKIQKLIDKMNTVFPYLCGMETFRGQ